MKGDEVWQHSLVFDPVLTVRGSGRARRRRINLPQVLSQLADGDTIADFPRLRAHQQHPLHAFLVQLAAMALNLAGETHPRQTAERWRDLLLALADGDEGAFALVLPDLARPAIFQPPVPDRSLKKWKAVESPDALDVLVTAKSHDIKATMAGTGDPETWFYALVTLQTMQGFLGAGNYGIARMNGGFASRPGIGLAPSLLPGPRFVRDVELLLESRDRIAEENGFQHEGGRALLWLEPWDGTGSLSVEECDPFFIEICRRVRFVEYPHGIGCFYTSTKCARLAAKHCNGVLGDPWIPVDTVAQKALTMPGSGFTYDRTQQLLWGSEYSRPVTQRLRKKDDGDMTFIGRVLVRGQGKTEGLHQRAMSIPGHIKRRMNTEEGASELAEHARGRVELAATMQRRVLRPALCVLIQGGPTQLKLDDNRVRGFVGRFDQLVDRCFFESLFAAVETIGPGDDLVGAYESWKHELVELAAGVLEEAIGSLPLFDARYFRSIAEAERIFYGAAKNNNFPPRFVRTPKGESRGQPNEEEEVLS